MAIYLKITNASDVVAKNTSKWFENITPDRIDRKLVEDQVIKGLIEKLQIEGIQGEISAGGFNWEFNWKFSNCELLVEPPLGRALIQDALMRFLIKADYKLEPGGDYVFTVRAKF